MRIPLGGLRPGCSARQETRALSSMSNQRAGRHLGKAGDDALQAISR